jgi:hypothetical protein
LQLAKQWHPNSVHINVTEDQFWVIGTLLFWLSL